MRFPRCLQWVAIHVLDRLLVSILTPLVVHSSLQTHCHLTHRQPWQKSMVGDLEHGVLQVFVLDLMHAEAVPGNT